LIFDATGKIRGGDKRNGTGREIDFRPNEQGTF